MLLGLISNWGLSQMQMGKGSYRPHPLSQGRELGWIHGHGHTCGIHAGLRHEHLPRLLLLLLLKVLHPLRA